MKIKVMGSNSDGNCYIINDELILDAGVPFKEIQQACGFNLNNKFCLITHEHMDHAKSALKLAEYSTIVFMSHGTKKALNIDHHNIKQASVGTKLQIGYYIIMPFEAEHDAAEPLGFLILDVRTKEKLLFATDTYFIRHKFENVDYFLLECNYSERIIENNVESGKLHPNLANRIRYSHFSLENVIEFLKGLNLNKTRKIMLIHLSDSNSDEKLFCREIEKEVAIETVALKKGDMVELIKF